MSSIKTLLAVLLLSIIAISQDGTLSGNSTWGVPKPVSSASWQLMSTPTGATQISNFAVNPFNGHKYLADRVSGFWKYNGTWSQINGGLVALQGWTIQVAPDGALIAGLCACTGVNTSPVIWYRSTNEGTTWTHIIDPVGFHLSLVGAYTGCTFDTVASNLICGGYFGQGFGWVSPNYGVNATTTIITTPVTGTVYGLGFNPVTKELFLGTEQKGVFRSTDHGFHWLQVSPNFIGLDPTGIRIGNVYGLAFNKNGEILAGSDGGVWKSVGSNGIYTWVNTLPNRNASAIIALGSDAAGNIYAGHKKDSANPITVYRSSDGGNSWADYSAGLPSGLEAHQFFQSAVDGLTYVVIENPQGNAGWIYFR